MNSNQVLEGYFCNEPLNRKINCIHRQENDESGPIGKITRNQDFDIIGGKFVYSCLCGSRNGLDQECKRLSCQGNNPGCKMNPPQCWPKYKPPPVQKTEITCEICLLYERS